MAKSLITEEVRELINEVAQTTATACFDTASEEVNYYKAMEALLNNYTKLSDLVSNEEKYLEVELQKRSKSIVAFSPGAGGGYNGTKTDNEVIEEIRQQREIQFQKTKARFEEVERVINLFKDRKEFTVIRLYYFNENIDGTRLPEDKRYTFEEIADLMDEKEILKDERTARRWRSRLINDMAVCMFGKAAAVNASRPRIKREVKEARNENDAQV